MAGLRGSGRVRGARRSASTPKVRCGSATGVQSGEAAHGSWTIRGRVAWPPSAGVELSPRAPDALAAATGLGPRDRRRAPWTGLVAEDVLVRLRPGIYLAPDVLETARRTVVAACERDGSVTIARLRDSLGTSRKHAQAILEHLDAPGSRGVWGRARVGFPLHLVASWVQCACVRAWLSWNGSSRSRQFSNVRAGSNWARGDQADPRAAPRKDRARPAVAIPAADRVDPAHDRRRHRGDVRDARLADGLAARVVLLAFFGREVLERLLDLVAAARRLLLLDLEVDLFAEHGMVRGAWMPIRTFSPMIERTDTSMSSPIMMLWFDFLVRTSNEFGPPCPRLTPSVQLNHQSRAESTGPVVSHPIFLSRSATRILHASQPLNRPPGRCDPPPAPAGARRLSPYLRQNRLCDANHPSEPS